MTTTTSKYQVGQRVALLRFGSRWGSPCKGFTTIKEVGKQRITMENGDQYNARTGRKWGDTSYSPVEFSADVAKWEENVAYHAKEQARKQAWSSIQSLVASVMQPTPERIAELESLVAAYKLHHTGSQS